ncbi:MAG: hypothetical protein KDN22_13200 [Verrucomicrobiae bacterium]|nr:hypothetical protein [Verrucomicrobiae bacterium]
MNILYILSKFLTLAVLLSPIVSQAQQADNARPPVSWVNPKLPGGPGLSHHVLKSTAMGHDVGYVVATPDGYEPSAKTRYPVVYFLHGMGGNESADAGGFSGLIRSAVRSGKMPPVICVFPNGGRSGYRGDVEKMIVEELIPLIDRSYPTKAKASSRVIAGYSMGGAGAVRLSLFHPELFCGAASWGGGMRRGVDELLAATEQLKNKDFAFLLVNGDQDRPDAYQALTPKLEAWGISHKVTVLKDTPHNLGLYYQLGGDEMVAFIGKRLQAGDKEQAAIPRKPVLGEKSWAITTMPDLGELAGPNPKKQHIVDHGFIRDATGKWQLWACIRGTAVGRLLYGWQGDRLTSGPWESKCVVMRADASVGENVKEEVEKIGAPHFLHLDGTWYCFYHSRGMHLARSSNGVDFARVLNEKGTSHCGIPGGRDVMVLEHGGRYYAYATVTTSDGKRSFVIGSESDDLTQWSKGRIVREGGEGGDGPVASESPFVVALDGYFYLFRASSHDFKTYVYRSQDPMDFGIHDDSTLITTMRLKAPEILQIEDQWYISDLADFQGIRMHELNWESVSD